VLTQFTNLVALEQIRPAFESQIANPQTRRAYWSIVKQWYSWCGQNNFRGKPEEVMAINTLSYVKYLYRRYQNSLMAGSSYNLSLSGLRAFFDIVAPANNPLRNPLMVQGIHQRVKVATNIGLEKFFQPVLIQKVVDYWSTRNTSLSLLVAMLYETGLRRAELCAVRESDIVENAVYDKAGTAYCVIRVRGKGNKEGAVYLSSALHQRIHSNRLESGVEESNPYLFYTQRGRITPSTVARWVKSAFAAVTDKEAHPHMLRHSAATAYIENGGSSAGGAQFLRHSTTRTFDKCYNHAEFRLESAPKVRL